MRVWPWVSKAYLAYMEKAHHDSETALRTEIEWLRAELAKALERRDRIDRVESGLTEVAHRPKEKREPMPPPLRDYIDSFASVSTRRQMAGVAYKRNAEGESWVDIIADVVIPEEPREKSLDVPKGEDGKAPEAERSTTG